MDDNKVPISARDAGPIPSSAAMHHAKALGHAEAAKKENAEIAAALQSGQYAQAVATAADMAQHRVLQAGEEIASLARAAVGGSSVKSGDTVNPSFVATSSATGIHTHSKSGEHAGQPEGQSRE